MKSRNILFTTILLVLACFASLPAAQAASPAPDGGYPGANTAEGQSALLGLTTGGYNTAVGFFSLRSDTTGSFNTAIGAGALLANTADENTATGVGALLSNTTGSGNTANGGFALFSSASGVDNTAMGIGALENNTDSFNTAIGASALSSNTTGFQNTALGESALLSSIDADGNTAIGVSALRLNTHGVHNTATGTFALFNNITGSENTAIGFDALFNNTTGQDNTANGTGALVSNNIGSFNNAFGRNALSSHTIGDGNVAIGESALLNDASGTQNTAVGNRALVNSIAGDLNIALGVFAGQNIDGSNNIDIGNDGVASESNTTRIGNASHTRTFIAGIHGVTTANTAIPVGIDSAGQLGTASSSRRYKKDIKPMEQASEAILSLEPVTFHYKSDTKDTPQFGLIAEEVAEVNQDLVVRDEKGDIYTVRYDAVNAMLLNEFLKEHRKVEKLRNDFQSTVARQQKEIQALTTQLKEQAGQIQKVSAQIELNKPAPQTVANR